MKKNVSKLPKLKPHLEQILILIYRLRFLNTKQIQTLLNHKFASRIITWLNNLTKQKYLKRYYSTKFDREPAFYSLGTVGRKYFKVHNESVGIKEPLLDRVWQEHKNSLQFKRNSMLLGDIYISLINLTKTASAKLGFYTKVDLFGMKYMIHPEPFCYFSIEDTNKAVKRYFLDIFDYFVPDDLYKRINKYMYYFEKRFWQDNTDKPFPEIILICPNKASKTFLEKTIAGRLKEKDLPMGFYLSSWEEITQYGICRQVLHKVEVVN